MRRKKVVIQTPFPTLEQTRKTFGVSKKRVAWIEGLLDGNELLNPRPFRPDYLRGVMCALEIEMRHRRIKPYKRGKKF